MNLRLLLKRVTPLLALKRLAYRQYYRIKRRLSFGRVHPNDDLGAKELWNQGIPHELGFWEHALKSGRFNDRLNANKPLDLELAALLRESGATGQPRILDIGSGPLTSVVGLYDGKPVAVIALDPLAKDYVRVMEKAGITPPVYPQAGSAEELLDLFEDDSFDLVTMYNALDHSFDPMLGLKNMFSVVRPGGFIYLWHFENEAEKEAWTGMHRWNLFCKRGDMMIANRSRELSVQASLGSDAEVRCRSILESNGALVTIIRKLKTQKAPQPIACTG